MILEFVNHDSMVEQSIREDQDDERQFMIQVTAEAEKRTVYKEKLVPILVGPNLRPEGMDARRSWYINEYDLHLRRKY